MSTAATWDGGRDHRCKRISSSAGKLLCTLTAADEQHKSQQPGPHNGRLDQHMQNSNNQSSGLLFEAVASRIMLSPNTAGAPSRFLT
jgi:hypothetical protein